MLFRFYQELLSAKVLVPFKGIIEGEKEAAKHDFTNFVAPSGINSIVKHFLHSSGEACPYFFALGLDMSLFLYPFWYFSKASLFLFLGEVCLNIFNIEVKFVSPSAPLCVSSLYTLWVRCAPLSVLFG